MVRNKALYILAFVSGFYLAGFGGESRQTTGKSSNKKLAIVYDERYLDYIFRKGSYESPQRLSAIIDGLKASSISQQLIWMPPAGNAGQFLTLIHTQKHIKKILSHKPSGNAALLAAGGAIAGVDAVLTSNVSFAFCAVRPPGHHARNAGREEGFCYFNNAALAVRYAQKKYGIQKALIVDWDYHHGNGTEEIFYEDSTVLFFSTHNAKDFPGTGSPKRKGAGAGKGLSINVHLGFRASDNDIISSFKKKLLPAANNFKPELVVISAGFDGRKDDPIGRFGITDYGFYALTGICLKIAKKHAKGRIVSIFEGGYNPEGNALAVLSHLKSLCK